MAKKMECNQDLMEDLLNRSKFGAMGQVFVMAAVQGYARMVLEGKDVDAPAPEALWREIAADVQARCEAFYARHSPGEQAEQAAPMG